MPDIKGNYSALPGADARLDLGYGTLDPKFNKPMSFVQYEPLTGVDPEAEEEIEEEIDPSTMEVILNKLLSYAPGDPYAKYKTDPFYMAGAATKLSELSTSKGMVPFPKMYDGRTGSGFGGSGAALPQPGPTNTFRTSIRPTGTKKGWSQAPYPEPDTAETINPEEEYSLKDILNADHDEDHLDQMRDLIKLIHLEQE